MPAATDIRLDPPPGNDAIELMLPDWSLDLLDRPERYIVIYGGRGGYKSTTVAALLLLRCATQPDYNVAVARDFKVTLQDGAIALLWRLAQWMRLPCSKPMLGNTITFANGNRIFAVGSERNRESLRGVESPSVVWFEEAQAVSKASFMLLDPSLRRPGAKIIMTFNPTRETDYVYEAFVKQGNPNAFVKRTTYGDIPEFMTPELDAAKEHTRITDPNQYRHVWYGELRALTGSFFDAELITPAPDTPDVPGIRAWDTAGTQDGGDYTVGVLMRHIEGRFHIADMVRGQWNSGEVERRIISTAQRDGDDTRVVIERGLGDAGLRDARRWAYTLRGFPFVSTRPTGAKAERARPVAAAINNGLVTITAGASWAPDLRSELAGFSEDLKEMTGRHDDIVDAVSSAYNHIVSASIQPERVRMHSGDKARDWGKRRHHDIGADVPGSGRVPVTPVRERVRDSGELVENTL